VLLAKVVDRGSWGEEEGKVGREPQREETVDPFCLKKKRKKRGLILSRGSSAKARFVVKKVLSSKSKLGRG